MKHEQKIAAIQPGVTLKYPPKMKLREVIEYVKGVSCKVDIIGTSLYMVTPDKSYIRLVASDQKHIN